MKTNISLYNYIQLLIIIVIFQTKVFSQNYNPDFRFIFMTDIHLEYGNNAVKGFRQAIDSINNINPDLVINGGDLIADALATGKPVPQEAVQKRTKLFIPNWLYIWFGKMAKVFNLTH